MGMYTELVCALQLKRNTPQQVINILLYMTGQSDEDILDQYGLPRHPLFSTRRWRSMLRCDSYSFPGETFSQLKIDNLFKNKPMYFLTIRCNLKNYDDEIELFIDWIKQHAETRGFFGYKRYEEDDHPTLLYNI